MFNSQIFHLITQVVRISDRCCNVTYCCKCVLLSSNRKAILDSIWNAFFSFELVIKRGWYSFLKTRKYCMKPETPQFSRELCFFLSRRGIELNDNCHRLLYLTMKVYEANPLIAVVLISWFLESTGQNTVMLKAT